MQAEAEFGCEETNVCGWMFAAEIHPNKKNIDLLQFHWVLSRI
jgi:hypothetical protein